MSYAEFIQRWTSPEYPPKAVAAVDLADVESQLGLSLPDAFQSDLCALGAASTRIALLNAIVDGDLGLADVQEFLTPAEMIQSTHDWRELGLATDAIAFAGDCMGNLFCFRAGSGAVWLWDHDLNEIEKVAPSFEEWIARYNGIEETPDED